MSGKLDGISLVIVDDDTQMLQFMERLIQRYGGIAKTADSYNAALAVLNDFTPDIVLIDIRMPNQDGYALIKTIRLMSRLRVPAIAVTAYSSESDRDAALQSGFQAHISKPFAPESLVDQINETLRRPMV
jgi:DNA-binding response OmpR family regulator